MDGKLPVTNRLLCYVRFDHELVCEGELAGRSYDFEEVAGVSNVVQIVASHDWMCALQVAGRAWCVGRTSGHFGGLSANNETRPNFIWWGQQDDDDVVAMDWTWNTICALTTGEDVVCASEALGGGPVVLASNVTKMYVADDGVVYETTSGDNFHTAWNGPTTPVAFETCRSANVGMYQVNEPGIVDGAFIGVPPDRPLCALGEDGTVPCDSFGDFGGQGILALGANQVIMDTAFAVRRDGAIVNQAGVEIQPSGSARVPECTILP
jgi:hypothetical protein